MPDFAYIARDNTGNKVSGTISAANRREVLATLGQAVAVSGGSERCQVGTGGARSTRAKRSKRTLMAVIYAQLADLLRSGVPLLRSLEVLKNQTSHAGLKRSAGRCAFARWKKAPRWPTPCSSIRALSAKWPSAWCAPAAKAGFWKMRWPASRSSPSNSKT